MTQHELSAEALEQQKSDAEAQRLAAERAAYYVLHGGPRPEGFVLPRLGREVPWPDEAGQGPPERRVSLLRAENIGSNHPPVLTIEVREQIGEVSTLNEARQLHARQAATLADAMLASLPGGTIDALLAELMRRRASLFSVPLQ